MADIRGKRRRGTASGSILSVSRRKVAAKEGAQIIATGSAAGKGIADRLGDEILLRIEMAVKPTVGEACGLHHLRHADGVEPLVAEQFAGDIQDPAAIFRHLLSADFHVEFFHRPY